MSVILLSLITALSYGIHDYVISKPSRVLSVPTLLLSVLVSNIIFLTLTLTVTQTPIVFHTDWIYVLWASVFWYWGFYFYSLAVKYGEIWISSSIANSYPLPTVLIWYFFLGEILHYSELFFFILILTWLIFSSFHIEEIKSRKLKKSKLGILFAFAAMLTWAGYVTFFDMSVRDTSVLLTAWYLDIFALAILFPIFLIKRKSMRKEVVSMNIKIFFYVGVLSLSLVVWMLALGYAFSLWNLAVVSAIAACSPAVTTLLARIFGNEKLETIQYAAIWILIFWIAGLSYVSV